MNLTNTKTILRQMAVNPNMVGCGGYLSDDPTSCKEQIDSAHAERIRTALTKYRDAMTKIGRPETVLEIAEVAGASRSSTNYFIKAHPEWFNRIEVMRDWQKTYLIELRSGTESD